MSFTEDEIVAWGPVLMQKCLEGAKAAGEDPGDSEEIGPVYSDDGKLLGWMSLRVSSRASSVSWPGGVKRLYILRSGGRWVYSGSLEDLGLLPRFRRTDRLVGRRVEFEPPACDWPLSKDSSGQGEIIRVEAVQALRVTWRSGDGHEAAELFEDAEAAELSLFGEGGPRLNRPDHSRFTPEKGWRA